MQQYFNLHTARAQESFHVENTLMQNQSHSQPVSLRNAHTYVFSKLKSILWKEKKNCGVFGGRIKIQTLINKFAHYGFKVKEKQFSPHYYSRCLMSGIHGHLALLILIPNLILTRGATIS